MSRHTTFRFCLDPTVGQHAVLARHAGASRFAFNQCLRIVKTGLTRRKTAPDVSVPWSGFDLINTSNAWKKTEAAGRTFCVDTDGVADVAVTGLSWRTEVCQQVFEEAAVDLGRALTAWSDSRSGKRKSTRVGFPRFKKKTAAVASFRVRNKHARGTKPAIRVGDGDRPRSVTLPGIGQVAVHDDTRRLRRLLSKNRAKVLFANVSRRAGRWWVGVDRGLSAFLVAATADGTEVARITHAPKALAAGINKQRLLAKSLSRKQRGSRNRRDAAAKLERHHHRVANVRHHFLHQVSNELVKTHDRLVLEDLNVAGMLYNHRLARAISDAGWSEFARIVGYKQAWRSGTVVLADRWYPSSKQCSRCGTIRGDLTLADRVFTCDCGQTADRDLNAAINLARWGQVHHNESPLDPRTPKQRGRATNARRRDGTGQHPSCAGETSPTDAGTDVQTPAA